MATDPFMDREKIRAEVAEAERRAKVKATEAREQATERIRALMDKARSDAGQDWEQKLEDVAEVMLLAAQKSIDYWVKRKLTADLVLELVAQSSGDCPEEHTIAKARRMARLAVAGDE